jgi:hypothetical protein
MLGPLDEGPWRDVSGQELTTDLMEITFFCEVSGLKLGDVELNQGPHTLHIRVPVPYRDAIPSVQPKPLTLEITLQNPTRSHLKVTVTNDLVPLAGGPPEKSFAPVDAAGLPARWTGIFDGQGGAYGNFLGGEDLHRHYLEQTAAWVRGYPRYFFSRLPGERAGKG